MKECKIRDEELKLVEESNDNIRQSNFETSVSGLSTWENYLLWDFDYHNSVHNTNILGDAIENSLTSKLLLFTSEFFKQLAEWLEYSTVELYSHNKNKTALTKIKQLDIYSGIFTLHSSSI